MTPCFVKTGPAPSGAGGSDSVILLSSSWDNYMRNTGPISVFFYGMIWNILNSLFSTSKKKHIKMLSIFGPAQKHIRFQGKTHTHTEKEKSKKPSNRQGVDKEKKPQGV